MQSYRRNKITKRILAMAAAASLFVSPSVSLGQNISKSDSSKANTIKVDGKVTNVTPDRTVNGGKTAINQFAKFELDRGNIANLHLGGSDTLVNFVDAKASINGIVNAVKNNKLGGNLYFLSSQGIAVGSEGAVNAGKVGLIVPNRSFYNDLLKAEDLGEKYFAGSIVGRYTLNPSGTITVAGTINAPGGITLAAQNVDISGHLNNTANINYSDIVNIKDENGGVSAGLEELTQQDKLELKADDTGIYITAHIDDDLITEQSSILDLIGAGFNRLGSPLEASIKVGENATINSDSNILMNASINANRTYQNQLSQTSNFYGFRSLVDIAGKVKGNNIGINSGINDTYTYASIVSSDSKQSDEDISKILANMMDIFSMMNLQKLLQNYGHVANSFVARADSAEINIGDKASLNATNNISLNNTSNFNDELNSYVTSKDDAGGFALNLTYLDNTADMKVKGTISAGGDVTLNTGVNAGIASTTYLEFDKSNNTASTLALNMSKGSSKSTLTIDGAANINAGGALNLSSVSTNPMKMNTAIAREGTALGALALTGNLLEAQSLLDVTGKLEAAGDINLSSKHTAPSYEIVSGIEVSNPAKEGTQTEAEAKKTQQASETIMNFTNEQGGGNNNTESATKSMTINGVVNLATHYALLAANDVTSTGGNLTIENEVNMGDPQVGAHSVVPVSKAGTLSPVIVVNKVQNTAASQIQGNLEGESINVKSKMSLDNPRLEQIKKDILGLGDNLKNVYKKIESKVKNAGDKEANAAFEEAKKRFDTYLDNLQNGMDPMQALTAGTNEIINDLKTYFANDEDVKKIIQTLETATDASKIGTIYADKENIIKTQEANPDFTLTASMLVNMTDNASTIQIYPGKSFKARSGDLTVDSTLKNVGLNVSGHILPKSLDTAATDAVVGVNIINDNNMVTFGGANTLQGVNVAVTADNDINHLLLNDGSGKGANNTYHVAGTVSYAGGGSTASVNLGAMPMIAGINSVKVAANNDTNLFNVAGGFSYGSGSAGVGVGVAVNDFDVTTQAILGNSTAEYTGAIFTPSLNVKATTDGMVNSLSVAGGVSTKSGSSGSKSYEEKSGEAAYVEKADETQTETQTETTEKSGIEILDSLNGYVNSDAFKKISETVEYFNKAKGVISQTKGKIDKAQSEKTGAKDKPDTSVPKTGEVQNEENQPKVTFDGAGSASVNLGSRNTQSSIVNVKTGYLESVDVGANDKNFTGAWSGAGALSFRGGKSASVALAGAVAVNKVDANVLSDITAAQNLTGTISNIAEKNGALVAAGLGLTVSKASGSSKNFAGAASASVNLADNVVKSTLSDNTVAGSSVANKAINNDTQITGGINVAVAAGGSSGAAMGGSGVWSDIDNDVNALVEGGSYNTSGTFRNQVGTTLTDIAAGAGVGVSTGGYGLQGVFTYNKVKNDAHANVNNAAITASNFLNTSADTTSGLKAYDSMLNNAGLDVTGDSYSDFAKVGEVESTKTTIDNKAAGKDGVAENTSKGYENSDYGNKIITGALAIAGSKKGAAQASIAISDVDNDFKAEVVGSSLQIADSVDITARSNTLDISAAAGAAVSTGKFSLGGSVSWQVNDNDVVAGFDGGTDKKSLSAKSLNIETGNKALEVNVAGQVSGGKGVAAGLGLAYNALTDNTDSYLKNGALGDSASVKVNAESGGKVYAVGAGVAASTSSAALNGVVGINHGSNSTTAEIEGVKGESINSLNVNTTDSVDKMAIVGGLTLSGGNVAVGGSVALNDVGSLGSQQATKVTIKDSDLKVNNDLKVNVKDDTELLTVGVGVGLTTGTVAVQGAAAVATLNKDVGIDVSNSDLKAKSISLNAATTEDLTTTADVLSVSNTVAVGAGVSINNDNTKTGVNVSGKSLKADAIDIESSNSSKVLTIGIGASGSASGAAVTGSVALNNLETNTSNNIKNATVEGTRGVSVAAKGDEAIANYGGNLALTGSGAAVGLSVSINNIDSNVASNVENSAFKGTGNSTKFSIADTVNDSAIRNTSVDKDTFNSTESLKSSRKNADYTGIVIDASATHDIKSALFNLSATGTGAAINGTVNINRVNGETAATTKDSTFDVGGDVNVIAHDYTNTSGLVGTGSVALTGAGIGIGSDSAVLNRSTVATLDGNGAVGSLKAATVKVDATGKQGVGSLVAGIAFAAEGAGLSNGVAVDLMSGKTAATISDVKGDVGSLDINSRQKTNLNTVGVSAGLNLMGAGVGLSVDVINNKADTTTSVKGADLKVSGKTDVKSNTDTNIGYELYDVGAAAVGGGVAGAVAVANNTAKTTTEVSNSTIDTKGSSANYTSNNSLTFKDRAVVGGVAGLGGGVGVGVTINTIDSSVNTNINGTVKSSGDLNISANESRNVKQVAAALSAGAGAASANVMITNVGKALENSYDSDLNNEDDGAHVSTSEEIDKANDAASNSKFGGDEISVGGMNVGLVKDSEKRVTMGGSKESGTHIKVGGTVEAKNININNTATNNITQEGLTGSAGGVSVNGAVGLVNLERNATSTLSGTFNATNKMTVNSTTDGTTTLDIKQGSAAGLLAANVSYADLTTSGVNAINVNGAKVNAAKELSINTDDTSTSKVNSIGVAVSATAAVGVLIADSTLESGNSINFTKATVEAPTINITAGGSPTAAVEAIAANGGALGAGTGLFAGTTNATTNTLNADANTTFTAVGDNGAGTVNFSAINGSKVSTKTDSVTGSIGVSGSVTAIKNVSNAAATVDVKATVKGNRTSTTTTTDVKTDKTTYYATFDSKDEHLYDYFKENPNVVVESKDNISHYSVYLETDEDDYRFKYDGAYNISSNVQGRVSHTYYIEFDYAGDTTKLDKYLKDNGLNVTSKDLAESKHFKLSSKNEIVKPTGVSNFKTSTQTDKVVIGKEDVTTYSGNDPKVSLTASATPTQKVDLVSIGAGGLLAATGSVANVQSNVNANVNANFNSINAEALTINTTAENTPDIDVKGLTVGAIATGSNLIKANRNITAGSTLGGGVNADTITINTTTSSTPDLYANGDGGGLVGISPKAAVIDDIVRANATTTFKGKVNADSINAVSHNTDGGKVKADALGAAVIGGSGVSLDRNVTGNATINVDGAEIVTSNAQVYSATNTLGNDSDLEAAGYGGINATAGGLTSNSTFNSAINLNKATFNTTGDGANITFNTNTDGNAAILNNLKAAGAIEIVISESDINTTLNNSINLNNTTISTTGNRANVVMSAYDRTEQRYQTIANIQGGAAGVANAYEDNTLSRNNSINLAGSSISADGVTLNTGYDSEGVAGKLTLTTFADVYNKTALPLDSDPEMNNSLSVKNRVNIDKDSTISTVRDVKMKAESGTEVIRESAKAYNVYQGDKAENKVTITTGHEGNPKESSSNYVKVDGVVETGIHNSLVVDLSGEYSIADGKEVNNITATVSKGEEFFDKATIDMDANAVVHNPFKEDYDAAMEIRDKYTPGTAEYKELDEQAKGIAKVMVNYGFAEAIKDKGGNATGKYIVYEQIAGPAIEIPSVNVAGGNVDIAAPTVKGSGKIIANAANELTINNATNKTILINDLMMDNAGGKVYLNDVVKTGSLNGVKLTTAANVTPKVNINNTGKAYKFAQTSDNPAYSKAPDIVVNGSVSNSAGEVKLYNKNGSVLVNGQIYSLTATKIETPNGGTIIDNSGGLQNVGSDPMLKWTFGNQKFAEWLQKYVGEGGISKNFSTYDEYLEYIFNANSAEWMGLYSFASGGKERLDEIAGSSEWRQGFDPSIGRYAGAPWNTIRTLWISTIKAKYAPEEFAKGTNAKYVYKVKVSLGRGGGEDGYFGSMVKGTDGLTLAGYFRTYVGSRSDEAIVISDKPLSSLTYADSLTLVAGSGKEPSGSIVAGGAVSIIAKTLNVNGLIQSGFNNYTATTSKDKVDKINTTGKITKETEVNYLYFWIDKGVDFSIDDYLKANPGAKLVSSDSYHHPSWNVDGTNYKIEYTTTEPTAPTDKARSHIYIIGDTAQREVEIQTKDLKDEDVIGNEDYKVNNTTDDITYNSESGMYDKVVGLYYNPTTNHILNDPVNVTGGVVYLKAEDFISTGSGKIVAAGGGADVNFTNTANADLYIKDINTVSRGDPVVMINNKNALSGVKYGDDGYGSTTYKPNSKAVYGWTGAINYNTISAQRAVTTKWLWGAITGGSTGAVVQQMKNEGIGMNVISTSKGDSSKPVDPGVFTDKTGDNNYVFSISTKKDKGGTVYGEMRTDSYFAKWYDYIIGRKTVEYNWTETTANYANTTYRINAAQPISIVTSNKKNTTFNAQNTQWHDLVIDGNLNLTGNSTINLTSHKAILTTKDENEKPLGSLTAKNINLKTTPGEGNNVDVVIGTLPKNEAINLNVENWGIGEVNIKSNAPIESLNYGGGSGWTNKTNLTLTAADKVSGSINTTGNVTIKSEDKINITSGSIGGTVNLTGDAGVKVNVSGDLKIGKIVSDGAVELTASGAIVNSVDKAVSMTGSAEKLQSWYDAGLISAEDADNESTNAAEKERDTRLKALENLFNRWALNDEGKVDKAYYDKLITHTADTSDFTAEQLNQYDLYQELKTSKTYGYSKNDLLYAIQEGLLNPAAGLTADVPDPIITGKSVKLNAASIGKDLQSVTYQNLTDTETLSKLAGAKLGDVTFNKDGSITMNEQAPVTIDLLDSKSKTGITTSGKTYIAGTTRTPLNINTDIEVKNDKVVLMAGAGITDENVLSAKQIELYAGDGDLKVTNLTVGSGGLVANALENIEIGGSADLTIKNVTAGDTITINNAGKITALNSDSKVRSGENINLTATNFDIGTSSTPLYLDTINANVNAGNATAYITGDYRFLTLKDKGNDYKNRKQYYNLITEDGGSYTLNTKKYVNASTSGNYSFAIRSLGDLYLGKIVGKDVELRAGGNIVGDTESSNVLQAASAHLFGKDMKDIKTSTSNITTRLTGTLDLKYTGSSDLNLTSERELNVENLDAGTKTVNINVKGDYTDTINPDYLYEAVITLGEGGKSGNFVKMVEADPDLTIVKFISNPSGVPDRAIIRSTSKIGELKRTDSLIYQGTTGGTKANITSGKLTVNATGDVSLNDPTLRKADTYKGNNLYVNLTTSNGETYHNSTSLTATLMKRVEDPKNLYFNVYSPIDDFLDLNTDKAITIGAPQAAILGVAADRDVDITLTSSAMLAVSNPNHLTNIAGGENTAWLLTIDNNALRGTINGKRLVFMVSGDLDLTTDSPISLLAGDNINITTTKLKVSDITPATKPQTDDDALDSKLETNFGYRKTMYIDTPTEVFYGSKAANPTYDIKTGNKKVTIEASQNFTLNTDNLNLEKADVGNLLTVTSEKDIKGNINAYQSNLTAKGDIELNTTKVNRLDKYKAENIAIESTSDNVKFADLKAGTFDYGDTLTLDAVDGVMYGARKSSPTITTRTGDKPVTIVALKDFTLTTDNLNLKQATVGETLKVTSDKDIKGTLSAKNVDLTAGGAVEVKSAKDITGKVNAKTVSLKSDNAVTVSSDKDITGTVSAKQTSLTTDKDINLTDSTINSADTYKAENIAIINTNGNVTVDDVKKTTLDYNDTLLIDTVKSLYFGAKKSSANFDIQTGDRSVVVEAAKDFTLTTDNLNLDTATVGGTMKVTSDKDITGKLNADKVDLTAGNAISINADDHITGKLNAAEVDLTATNKVDITAKDNITGKINTKEVDLTAGKKITVTADKDLIGKVSAEEVDLTAGNEVKLSSDKDIIGKVTSKKTSLTTDKDINLTDSTISSKDTYKAENVAFTTNDSAITVDIVKKASFDYANSLMINTVKDVYFDAKKNSPAFDIKTGDKTVTITAAKNFTLTTDNLNLDTATVGGTMKVTSDKDITGLLNAAKVDLTAGNKVAINADDHITGKINAAEVDLTAVNKVTVTADENLTGRINTKEVDLTAGNDLTISSDGDITGKVNSKTTNLTTKENVTIETDDLNLTGVAIGKNFTATSGKDINSTGDYDVKGDSNLTAPGTVNIARVTRDITGSITAKDVNIYNAKDVSTYRYVIHAAETAGVYNKELDDSTEAYLFNFDDDSLDAKSTVKYYIDGLKNYNITGADVKLGDSNFGEKFTFKGGNLTTDKVTANLINITATGNVAMTSDSEIESITAKNFNLKGDNSKLDEGNISEKFSFEGGNLNVGSLTATNIDLTATGDVTIDKLGMLGDFYYADVRTTANEKTINNYLSIYPDIEVVVPATKSKNSATSSLTIRSENPIKGFVSSTKITKSDKIAERTRVPASKASNAKNNDGKVTADVKGNLTIKSEGLVYLGDVAVGKDLTIEAKNIESSDKYSYKVNNDSNLTATTNINIPDGTGNIKGDIKATSLTLTTDKAITVNDISAVSSVKSLTADEVNLYNADNVNGYKSTVHAPVTNIYNKTLDDSTEAYIYRADDATFTANTTTKYYINALKNFNLKGDNAHLADSTIAGTFDFNGGSLTTDKLNAKLINIVATGDVTTTTDSKIESVKARNFNLNSNNAKLGEGNIDEKFTFVGGTLSADKLNSKSIEIEATGNVTVTSDNDINATGKYHVDGNNNLTTAGDITISGADGDIKGTFAADNLTVITDKNINITDASKVAKAKNLTGAEVTVYNANKPNEYRSALHATTANIYDKGSSDSAEAYIYRANDATFTANTVTKYYLNALKNFTLKGSNAKLGESTVGEKFSFNGGTLNVDKLTANLINIVATGNVAMTTDSEIESISAKNFNLKGKDTKLDAGNISEKFTFDGGTLNVDKLTAKLINVNATGNVTMTTDSEIESINAKNFNLNSDSGKVDSGKINDKFTFVGGTLNADKLSAKDMEIEATGNVSITSDGDINATGKYSVDGKSTLTAGGDINIANGTGDIKGDFSADNLTIVTDKDITVNDASKVGTVKNLTGEEVTAYNADLDDTDKVNGYRSVIHATTANIYNKGTDDSTVVYFKRPEDTDIAAKSTIKYYVDIAKNFNLTGNTADLGESTVGEKFTFNGGTLTTDKLTAKLINIVATGNVDMYTNSEIENIKAKNFNLKGDNSKLDTGYIDEKFSFEGGNLNVGSLTATNIDLTATGDVTIDKLGMLGDFYYADVRTTANEKTINNYLSIYPDIEVVVPATKSKNSATSSLTIRSENPIKGFVSSTKITKSDKIAERTRVPASKASNAKNNDGKVTADVKGNLTIKSDGLVYLGDVAVGKDLTIEAKNIASGTSNSYKVTGSSNLSATGTVNVPNAKLSSGNYEERDYADVELRQLAKALNESNILTGRFGEDYDNTVRAWLAGMGYSEVEEQRVIDLTRDMLINDVIGKSLFNAAVEQAASKYSEENLNAESTI